MVQRLRDVVATAGMAMLFGVVLLGCGGQQPQPGPPTKQEVQGDSDQFFEELRREEQDRGKSGVPTQ